MGDTMHEIDKNGDVILILAEESQGTNAQESKLQHRMRVSSKHITLASRYFQRMLQGQWKEGEQLRSRGHVEIPIEENWEVNTFIILLNIIHCRSKAVPETVNLQTLVDLTVLADFYDCVDAVHFYAGAWIHSCPINKPKTYSEDLVKWMFVCLAFDSQEHLNPLMRIYLRHGSGPIDAQGLPLADSVISKLDKRRRTLLQSLVTEVHEVMESLEKGNFVCCNICDCLRLGALRRGVREIGLLPTQLQETAFLGLSFDKVTTKLRGLVSPSFFQEAKSDYQSGKKSRHSGSWDTIGLTYKVHQCSLVPNLEQLITTLQTSITEFGMDMLEG